LPIGAISSGSERLPATAIAVPDRVEAGAKCSIGWPKSIRIRADGLIGFARYPCIPRPVAVQGRRGSGKLPIGLFLRYHLFMSAPETLQPRKCGPKPTGTGAPIQVRLQPDRLAKVDDWREAQHDSPTRPETIRRLVESAL